jgi:ribosomal protein L44E
VIYQPPAQCISAYITLLVDLIRSPIHHHGTLIYPLYPRLCTYLGTYCSCTHIATLLAIACDKFGASRFTIIAALHRQPAIGASGSRRFDRRSNGRTSATSRVEQEKRRKHGLSTQTHLQCHGASTTIQHNQAPRLTRVQANQSRLPCPLPPCPLAWPSPLSPVDHPFNPCAVG